MFGTIFWNDLYIFRGNTPSGKTTFFLNVDYICLYQIGSYQNYCTSPISFLLIYVKLAFLTSVKNFSTFSIPFLRLLVSSKLFFTLKWLFQSQILNWCFAGCRQNYLLFPPAFKLNKKCQTYCLALKNKYFLELLILPGAENIHLVM